MPKTARNYPKVGFTVDHFRGLKPHIIIDAMRYLGIDFVEINHSIFSDLDKAIRSLDGITTAFHLPYQQDFNLWSEPNEPITSLLNQLAQHEDDLHIRHYVVHPPETDADGDEFSVCSSRLLNNLQELSKPVYVENIIALSPERFSLFLLEARKKLGEQFAGQCWDACHYIVSGYDPLLRLQESDGTIGAVHLSDCYGNKDAHSPFFEEGSVPAGDILDELARREYSGTITLEMIPNSRTDIQAYLNSYLLVLKKLNKPKYYKTRLRFFLLKPFISKVINGSYAGLHFQQPTTGITK